MILFLSLHRILGLDSKSRTDAKKLLHQQNTAVEFFPIHVTHIVPLIVHKKVEFFFPDEIIIDMGANWSFHFRSERI